MTVAGRDKLEAEIRRLETVERPRVAQDVAEARSLGDLRENGQYHAAREELGQIDAKVALLKDKLARSELVREAGIDRGIVAIGAKVTVQDLSDDSEEVFHLVGEGEQDYAANKILVTAPFAQGLVGRRKGETAEVQIPRGILRYRILEIEYPG